MPNFVFQILRNTPIYLLILLSLSCSTNPNKPTEQSTVLEKSQQINPDLTLGLNQKGEVVTNKKIQLVDYIKTLQQEVIQYETEIYGNEELGRRGLYGALRSCLDKGSELKRLPEKAILTKSENQLNGKMIIDEQSQLVSVSEEFLTDRMKRYEGYRNAYEKQKEDYEERIRICEAEQKEPRK